MRRSSWLIAVIALLVAPPAAGKSSVRAQAAAACSVVIHSTQRDTVPVYLAAYGEPLRNEAAAHLLGLVLEDVLARFNWTETPFTPTWPNLFQRHDVLTYGEGGSLAAVRFTMRRDGSIPNLAPVEEIWHEELESSLLDAVSAAVADKTLPLLPPTVSRDSFVVVLALRVDPDGAVAYAEVGRAVVPQWTVTPVQLLRSQVPRHPLRNGTVIVRAVVQPSGVLDLEAAEVIRSDHPQLLRAVLGTLPRWRFEPAAVNGCPVPQLVDIPVTFRGAP